MRKDYFDNLNVKNVTDNKTFWKTVKPFFTYEGTNHNKIILAEDDKIISENEQVSESLNNYFLDAIINLNIPQYKHLTFNTSANDDPVTIALENRKTILALN